MRRGAFSTKVFVNQLKVECVFVTRIWPRGGVCLCFWWTKYTSLSECFSHFGIMCTHLKAPLKFFQTQFTQDSASFMGPHNCNPIMQKVASLSAGYQYRWFFQLGILTSVGHCAVLDPRKVWVHAGSIFLYVSKNVWQATQTYRPIC